MDVDGYHLIAAFSPMEDGNAFIFQTEDPTGLGARWDAQFYVAVKRGDVDFVSKRCLSHVDVDIEQNVVAIAPEEFVRSNLDFDVKITIRTAISARLPFADHADLIAIINASRDVNFFAGGLSFQPGSPAGLAGSFNHLTASAAGWAGYNLHHLSEEGLLNLADFTAAFAGLASYRL